MGDGNIGVFVLLFIILVLLVLVIITIYNIKKDVENNIQAEMKLFENSVQAKLEDNKSKTMDNINKSNSEVRMEIDNKFSQLSISNDSYNNNLFKRVDVLNKTFSEQFERMQISNENKLKEIQKTVDTQLHDILQKRINESFNKVNDHLVSVQKGLGEMRDLARNVGDLKATLGNIKTRGIIGELQLSRILEQTLASYQYVEQAAIYPDSTRKVDFAIKLPGKDNDMQNPVYLPIDAKFPMDRYNNVLAALNSNDAEAIKQAKNELYKEVKSEAKSISEKYIMPPLTTDFALLFFPAECLYAEVINNVSLTEELFNKYKINITGPSTISAYLNSLQMGFRTLAIEQKSSDIFKVLEEVKIEFNNYSNSLAKVKEKIGQANKEMDYLMSTRTNQMQNKLNKINMLEDQED